MRLLLDTHALLWWLGDDQRLGTAMRDLIAAPDQEVLASAVSLWEIVVKKRIGKLQADVAAIARALSRDGFGFLGVETAHLLTLDSLALHSDHRDPFDHLLIAQAIAEGATLVSDDRNMGRYGARLLPCSGDLPQATGQR